VVAQEVVEVLMAMKMAEDVVSKQSLRHLFEGDLL
jgi:hypothetical protein